MINHSRVLIVGALLLAAPVQAATEAFAIVVGNNAPPLEKTSASLGTLRFADDDAVRYFQFFRRMTHRVQLLTVLDQETQRRYPGLAESALPPNLDNLTRVIDRMAREIKLVRRRGDEAVFYLTFSGHGAVGQDQQAFLALLDASLRRQQLLETILVPLNADYSHLLIDACHAGGVVGVRGIFGKEVDAAAVDVTRDDTLQLLANQSLSRLPGVGAVIATSANEEAHEWSHLQAGVFTHEVLSGLMGGADVDADGQVDYLEIQAFVTAAHRDIEDPRAVPKVIALAPQRNSKVALVKLKELRDTVFLRGDPEALGHFHIELANGQRYIDCHLQGFRDVQLALPVDTTLYVRTEGKEVEVTTGTTGDISFAGLQMQSRQRVPRGSIESAYRQALFASPFSATYYRGFLDSLQAAGPRVQPPTTEKTAESTDTAGVNWLLLGGAGTAAVGAMGFAVSSVLAAVAFEQWNSTNEQRPAYEANQRFTWFAVAAVVSAVVGATGAVFVGVGLLEGSQQPETNE